ncbi:hypothetical protein CCL17_26040 [Pseudomonas congelans]|nr:hypothetical protein CCL17_26040 [Pseudomonas congelans]
MEGFSTGNATADSRAEVLQGRGLQVEQDVAYNRCWWGITLSGVGCMRAEHGSDGYGHLSFLTLRVGMPFVTLCVTHCSVDA